VVRNRGIVRKVEPKWLAAKRPVLGRGVAKTGIVFENGRLGARRKQGWA
jgi:hypothetical protein